jgi:hypothetical protein
MATNGANRGGCLTALLVMMTLADLLAALAGFFFHWSFASYVADVVPAWGFSMMGALALSKLVCVIGIWNWRKWGVMGTLVIGVISAATSLFTSFGILSAIGSLIVPGLLVLCVRPVWRHFR